MDEHTLLHMLHVLVHSKNVHVLSYDECISFFETYRKQNVTYVIFNNQPRPQSGEHWIALYLYGNGYVDFFDSYGNTFGSFQTQYRALFNVLMKKEIKIKHESHIRVQDFGSSLCGAHCLFLLVLRYMNVPFQTIYNKVYHPRDSVLNDSLIEKFIKIFFSDEDIIYYLKTHEQGCKSLKHYASNRQCK